MPTEDLADTLRDSNDNVTEANSLAGAMAEARSWAARGAKRAVLVTGSITLIGDVMALASAEGWKS